MTTQAEEINKMSVETDGTVQEQVEDFSDSEEESNSCYEIHDNLVILSTQGVGDDIEATFTVGKYPNAKIYTQNISDMLEDIRGNGADYDVGVGQIFVEAKSRHARALKHNYKYPFGNDVDDTTFTLQAAIANGCIVQSGGQGGMAVKTDINPSLMGNYIMEHLHMKSVKGSEVVLIYNNGYYGDSENLKHVRMAIVDTLGIYYRRNIKDEILSHIKDSLLKDTVVVKDEGDFVCLQNGLVNTHTLEWTFHNHNTVLFHQLPYPFDPTKTRPKLDKYLDEVLMPLEVEGVSYEDRVAEKNKKKNNIYEIYGYQLEPNNARKKFFSFYGGSNTFKTVAATIAGNFVGADLTSAVPLAAFSGEADKFATASMKKSWVNICPELDRGGLQSINQLKSMTGEDDIYMQDKYGKPFKGKIRSKILIPTNELPKLPETDQASFFKRLIIIPFQQQVADKDIILGLADQLSTPEELSGIFNKALEGLQRLEQNKMFSYDTEDWESKRDFYMSTRNSFEMFLQANYRVLNEGQKTKYKSMMGINACVFCSDVWENYIKYCQKKSINPEQQDGYKGKVVKIFNNTISATREKHKNGRDNHQTFRGLLTREEYNAFFNESDEDGVVAEVATKPLPSADKMIEFIGELIASGNVTLRKLAMLDDDSLEYAKQLIKMEIVKETASKVLIWAQ